MKAYLTLKELNQIRRLSCSPARIHRITRAFNIPIATDPNDVVFHVVDIFDELVDFGKNAHYYDVWAMIEVLDGASFICANAATFPPRGPARRMANQIIQCRRDLYLEADKKAIVGFDTREKWVFARFRAALNKLTRPARPA